MYIYIFRYRYRYAYYSSGVYSPCHFLQFWAGPLMVQFHWVHYESNTLLCISGWNWKSYKKTWSFSSFWSQSSPQWSQHTCLDKCTQEQHQYIFSSLIPECRNSFESPRPFPTVPSHLSWRDRETLGDVSQISQSSVQTLELHWSCTDYERWRLPNLL